METILDKIKSLDSDDWDYYQDRDSNKMANNLSEPFTHNHEDIHRNFIEEYFKIAGKGQVYDSFNINVNNFRRPMHTNSVFFIGCLLYNHLNLKEKMGFDKVRDEDHFYFIWFVTVLAHDFSYIYESDFNTYKKTINDDIKTLKKELNIGSHDLLHLLSKAKLDNKIKILTENISNYYSYRYNENCKIDHGITAGLKLFSSLESNRIKMLQKDEHDNGGLYWGNDLTSLYAEASFAITTHNIWVPDVYTVKLYEEYGMEKLAKIFPISFNDFSLLFLLGLVDTLDPVKIYSGCQPKYVLENILIDFPDENIITFRNNDESSLDFTQLVEKALGLIGWLDVEVCTENNLLKIEIKGN